jgi:hypothetical protein
MEEVLVDRYVIFEDELAKVIGERGGTPESLTVESMPRTSGAKRWKQSYKERRKN